MRGSSWTANDTGTANTEKTLTKAAAANQSHYVAGYHVATKGAAIAADAEIEIRAGSTVIFRDYFGNGEPRGTGKGGNFTHPLWIPASTAVSLVVGELGADCIAELNLWGYTE